MGKLFEAIFKGLRRTSCIHGFSLRTRNPTPPGTLEHHRANSIATFFPPGISNAGYSSSEIYLNEYNSKNLPSNWHFCHPSMEIPLPGSCSVAFACGLLELKNSELTMHPCRPFFHKPSSELKIRSELIPVGIGTRAFSSGSLGFDNTNGNPLLRWFSKSEASDAAKNDGESGKSIIGRSTALILSAFSHHRDAIFLQMEAFLERNSWALIGASGVGLCLLLWKIIFEIANAVGFSQDASYYRSLAMATAAVTFAGLYVRSRFTVNPDRIYRMALRKLNMSAGVLEVMGTPLKGTDLRAYVISGGIRLKNFKLRIDKWCFLVFPVRGSQGNGLVSVGVKKRKGQYDMKLLAVDIPMASGPDHRLFVIGDDEKYGVGDGLISGLRDPIVKAMSAKKEFEYLDQKEEEENAERELQEAEKKLREEVEKLEKNAS